MKHFVMHSLGCCSATIGGADWMLHMCDSGSGRQLCKHDYMSSKYTVWLVADIAVLWVLNECCTHAMM